MADGKLLEEDKDEWFYQSMKKYSNLYMFELEFPLDTLEIINETSLCVSGIQEYSKNCELLQLCVPPKLLRDESEEGLCKDRDFKILSGGYADSRIRQIKFIKSSTNLVATYQDGYSGVVLYEVGDDDRATILEKCRFAAKDSTVSKGQSLCYMENRVLLGTVANGASSTTEGVTLYEWKIEDKSGDSRQIYNIWKANKDFNPGYIIKTKEWDRNTCIFLTSRGTLALYDFRTGSDAPDVFFHATKSPNNSNSTQIGSETANSEILFSFDCISRRFQVGVLDSCGGYETFDTRFVSRDHDKAGDQAASSKRPTTLSRSLLPEFTDVGGVYADSFNIEYEERTKVRENERIRFIISGLKRECVPVLEENLETTADSPSVQPVFSHDGHSKPVTHATWHPASENLIFSASLDAVLHAWQFIPDN